MAYAKLINNQLEYAPNPIQVDDKMIFTNDPTEYGYKEIINSEMPIDEDYSFTEYFEETDDSILGKWQQHELTPPMKVNKLKQKLADTDYIACKIAEGAATREEYAAELAQRAAWREQIRQLENEE